MIQCEAYLDIETTGLSPGDCRITVVGIYVCKGEATSFFQYFGPDVTAQNILAALEGVDTIYTYNGSRFDLPFIQASLGIDLAGLFAHCDLMYDCWRNNLYGGLKSVERQIGISRQLVEVNGYEAIRLWQRYVNKLDMAALNKLLAYNKEDVVNLKALNMKLCGF